MSFLHELYFSVMVFVAAAGESMTRTNSFLGWLGSLYTSCTLLSAVAAEVAAAAAAFAVGQQELLVGLLGEFP